MTSDLVIRVACPGDREAVFPLARAMASSFEVDKKCFGESFSEIIQNPSAICLVAERNGEMIGYLIGFDHRTFYANGRVSWVEEVFVVESLRREGIGRKLMKRFEDWCIERGSKLVGLATRRASEFYRAIDYEESAVFFRKLLNHKGEANI